MNSVAKRSFIKIDYFNEQGYSLVESMVSLALFITVLLPLVHYVSIQVSQKRAQSEIQALLIAQKAIEEAIASPGLLATTRREGRWVIQTRYTPHPGGLSIRVQIKKNQRPYAQLLALKPLDTLEYPINLSG